MINYLSQTNLKKYNGKTALVRIDLNIEPGQEKKSTRLDAIVPTINHLLKNNIKIVLLSHRGRPTLKPERILKGLKSDWNFNKENQRLSLKIFTQLLKTKIDTAVRFIPYEHSWLLYPKDFVNSQKEKVFLLENLRFYHGEEENDWRFGKFLADWGDFYVNDAFAISHRKNASVVAITKYLPSYAGLLLEREIKNLDKIVRSCHRGYRYRPFIVIIGGAKISDKLDIIKNFWNKADYFLLGGGPANTFFAVQGLPIGKSLVDKDIFQKSTSQILKLIRKEVHKEVELRKIISPIDVKISNKKILDIGERTILWYSEIIKKSRTIIWNGPMGLFEKKRFKNGTVGIWKAILANRKAQIVVGGGETIIASKLILNFKSQILKRDNIFISTGGGAMLAYLAGKKLPGIISLNHPFSITQ